ncbi:MAG: HPF/RaiA family ribosome-associated protein [Candidatus Sumerlaeales bacterium]|nr:HPF/RaiA family ribosome-associated protein [Candidatus Sumerlaeales bacterium]
MPIRITGRHQADTEEIKGCVEKKLQRLTRIVGDPQSVSLTIDRDSNKAYVLEILFRAGPIEAAASAKDQQYTKSADKLITKLERQISKALDKLRGDTKTATRALPQKSKRTENPLLEKPSLEDEEKGFDVEQIKPLVLKKLKKKVYPALAPLTQKMTVEQAVETLLAHKKIVLFFRNTDSADKKTFIFLRPDGNIGLVEM